MPQTFITGWLNSSAAQPAQNEPSPEPKDVLLKRSRAASKADETLSSQSLAKSLESKKETASSGVPNGVSTDRCTRDLIRSLRSLNIALFPIPYQERFYEDILNDPVTASITRIALFGSTGLSAINKRQLVGAIRCRLLDKPPYDSHDRECRTLYIATLGVLAPFRNMGIASTLLHEVERAGATSHGALTVVAHVWEKHEESLEWYKRKGFTVVTKVEGYYSRLRPYTSAWIVRRDIMKFDP